jgi:2,3-bisphosphoglycerate-independent phosphoglycerate mutase
VPLLLIGNNLGGLKLADGRLADIAPTILDIMGLPKPAEMSGSSLLVGVCKEVVRKESLESGV